MTLTGPVRPSSACCPVKHAEARFASFLPFQHGSWFSGRTLANYAALVAGVGQETDVSLSLGVLVSASETQADLRCALREAFVAPAMQGCASAAAPAPHSGSCGSPLALC